VREKTGSAGVFFLKKMYTLFLNNYPDFLLPGFFLPRRMEENIPINLSAGTDRTPVSRHE
jgi:hypothetical protein